MRVRNKILIPSTAAEALADCMASQAGITNFRQAASRAFGIATPYERGRADALIFRCEQIVRNLPARGYRVVRVKR